MILGVEETVAELVVDQHVDHHWAFDLVRILTVLLAGGLVFSVGRLLVHWRTLPMQLDRKLRYLALMMYGILTAVQESQQYGDDFVWWRLPLLFLATVSALAGMIVPEAKEWVPPKQKKRFEKGIEWPSGNSKVG